MNQGSLAQPLKYEFMPLRTADDGAEPEPRQSLTDAEVETLRREAFSEGEARARAEAEAAIERRRADALEAAAGSVRALVGDIASARGEIEESAAALAIAVGRAVGGYATARAPLQVVRPMVAEALDTLFDEVKVVIEVHEAIVDLLKEEIDAVVAETGFPGQVRVRAHAHADSVADCRIDWGEGGVERRIADITRAISDRAAAHGIALPPARVAEEVQDG